MTHNYEEQIRSKFRQLAPLILKFRLNFQRDKDTNIIFLNGSIIFIDESVFEFTEKFSSLGHRYRFHYMDKKKNLIVRWDNIPHHRNFLNFPYHKHINSRVEPSEDLNLIDALGKVQEYVKIP